MGLTINDILAAKERISGYTPCLKAVPRCCRIWPPTMRL